MVSRAQEEAEWEVTAGEWGSLASDERSGDAGSGDGCTSS